MELDLEFPHAYNVEVDPELPGSGVLTEPVFEFPEVKAIGVVSAMVRVTPDNGKPWIGRFWDGYPCPPAISRVFSCISKTSLCVVAAGNAFIIPVLDPCNHTSVSIFPITEAHRMPVTGLMLFADFSRLALYHAQGPVWSTHHLWADGIRVTRMNETQIEGLRNEPGLISDTWIPFILDVSTGRFLTDEVTGNPRIR